MEKVWNMKMMKRKDKIITNIQPNQSNIVDNFNSSYDDDINSNSIYEIIELEGSSAI